MAALTANRKVPNYFADQAVGGDGLIIDMPIGAAEVIYQGALLSLDAGDFYPAPLAAGEQFLGVALEAATGGAANGDVNCRVLIGGAIQHAVGGTLVWADMFQGVSASDDQTIAKTKTGNSAVGRIISVPVAGTGIIKCKFDNLGLVGTEALGAAGYT